MVALWARRSHARHRLHRDRLPRARVLLLATSVLTLGDIAKEGDVLATFIWFACCSR
jgi:hypothetical protein